MHYTISHYCLQCFDAVGWVAGRASALQKLSGEVLALLSVWSEVEMICIWSSWCHCQPIISWSSKIQNGLPFWCRLTQVVLEKRPLNGCSMSQNMDRYSSVENMPNVHYLQLSFTNRIINKFVVKRSLKILPQLKRITTMPCKTLMSENLQWSKTGIILWLITRPYNNVFEVWRDP